MRLFSIVISLVFLGSCLDVPPATEDSSPFELSKLVGRWESASKKNSQVEEWKASGENELTGVGFVLDHGDTTFIEYLRISGEGGALTYYAMVSDENEGQSIPFKLKSNSEMTMTFENPTHDFPQVIVYELVNDSLLTVFVEGKEDGTFRRIKFDFEKKK